MEEVRYSDHGENIRIAQVGPEEDAAFALSAFALHLQPDVPQETMVRFAERLQQLADEFEGIKLLSHGPLAIEAYLSTIDLCIDLERRRAMQRAQRARSN